MQRAESLWRRALGVNASERVKEDGQGRGGTSIAMPTLRGPRGSHGGLELRGPFRVVPSLGEGSGFVYPHMMSHWMQADLGRKLT